jgi:hypothetical protein
MDDPPENEPDVKSVAWLPPEPARTMVNPLPAARVVTKTSSWIRNITEPSSDLRDDTLQLDCLADLRQNLASPTASAKRRGRSSTWDRTEDEDTTAPSPSPSGVVPKSSQASIARAHILHKISGYKYQDQEKRLWNPDIFVNLGNVLELMHACQLLCFYCRKPVMILYDNVREPRQWTLERIDNSQGHVRGNVQIACLTCNLRRRTMHHERYILTKRMVHVTKLDHPS